MEKVKIKDRIKPFFKRAFTAVRAIVLSPFLAFRLLIMTLGGVSFVFLLVTGFSVISFQRSLPDLEHMGFQDLKAVAKKRVHMRLENKKTVHRWVSIKETSRDLLYAIVMSEDSKFFEHSGVNFDAIAESMLKNIKKGRYAYGASTISQQVVKNLFLTREKTIFRKLKEVIITMDLEARFKKNEILELYLNLAEFGPDLYGVDAASRRMFSRKASELNAAEGAFLALMLPSPRRNYYSIFENKNLTRKRKEKIKRILKDMLFFEFISPEQYHAYLNWQYFTNAQIKRFRKVKRLPASRR